MENQVNTVPMFAPDGTLGDIPYERMREAQQAGFVMGVNMLAPDGSKGVIPANRVKEATAANYKTIPYDFSSTGGKIGFLDTAKQIGKNMISGVAEMAKNNAQVAAENPQNPVGSVVLNAAKQFGSAVKSNYAQDATRKAEGYNPVYRALAPAVAPVVGVDLQGMEKAAQSGDTGAVMAHAAVPAALAASPLAVEGASKVLKPVVNAAKETKIVQMAGDAVQGAKAAWNPEKNLTPVQAATKAFRPRNSKTTWATDVQSALPDARRAADSLGIDLEKMTMDDALKATSQAKKDVWAEYQKNILDPAKQSGATVSGDTIADAIRSKITDRMREQRPGLVKRIENTAKTYEGKNLSVEEAQDRLTEANNETRAIEAKYVTDKRAAKQSPSNAYRFAERDTLRTAMDDVLNKVSGPGGAELRKRWGALNSMEDVISRRIPVAERANPVSLTRVLELVHGPGKIVRGVATGNIGDIAMGVFNTKRLSNAEMMNNPDWLTQQAFKKTVPTPAPQPSRLIPVRGLLPAGSIELGAAPDAALSFSAAPSYSNITRAQRLGLLLSERAGGPFAMPPSGALEFTPGKSLRPVRTR